MSKNALPNEVLCPLCKSPLYVVRSYMIPVWDDFGAQVEPRDSIGDGWEVVCEASDHRLASGNIDADGRSAKLGYREAQSLGGVR